MLRFGSSGKKAEESGKARMQEMCTVLSTCVVSLVCEPRSSFQDLTKPRSQVSLPELIAQTNMDSQSVNKLREEIQKLTSWLGKNSNRFFTAEYETASNDYVENNRGV